MNFPLGLTPRIGMLESLSGKNTGSFSILTVAFPCAFAACVNVIESINTDNTFLISVMFMILK